MSKRDGKMYIPMMLTREIDNTLEIPIKMETKEIAGCVLVFWTKTAARKYYGRNVQLIQIGLIDE